MDSKTDPSQCWIHPSPRMWGIRGVYRGFPQHEISGSQCMVIGTAHGQNKSIDMERMMEEDVVKYFVVMALEAPLIHRVECAIVQSAETPEQGGGPLGIACHPPP